MKTVFFYWISLRCVNLGSVSGVSVNTNFKESYQSFEGRGTGEDFTIYGFCPQTLIFYRVVRASRFYTGPDRD